MSHKNGRIIKCDNCGKEKYKPLAKLKRAKNYFCSHKCFDEFRLDRLLVKCEVCGKEMERVRSQAENKKYIVCGIDCFAIRLKGVNLSGFFKTGNKGEKCINFKDGTQITNGYISELAPDHPLANRRGYVYQHRLVMEKMIGRYLTQEEVVHHIDEDKQNNDPSNLMLFENDAVHQRHHRELRKLKIKRRRGTAPETIQK